MKAKVVTEDMEALGRELDAAERDARAVVEGLSEEQGAWRAQPGSWSVAECLDHLATANSVYLRAMQPSAESARSRGRQRRGPAKPGLLGGLFIRSLEPPARTLFKTRAHASIQPRASVELSEACAAFVASQNDVRAFLDEYDGIDLAGVTFPNPFVRGIRFSLATGLHVIPAHERRHLWQAWRVREAAARRGIGS